MSRIGILTSGGDAPGMNICINHLTYRLLQEGHEVYGIIDGYKGIMEKQVIKLDNKVVNGIENRGGTILKTARLECFAEKEVQLQAVENLKELGIDTLLCLGGDGTFKGALALHNLGIKTIGIPCTIDNDLDYTESTIGYKTAVQTCVNCIENLKDTMESHERVSMVETMGRHRGYIALESGVLTGCKFVVIPEVKFSIKEIADQIKEDIKNGVTADMICIAEGAMGTLTSFEFHKEIEKELGFSIKRNVIGHIQRGGSPVISDKELALRMCNEAVKLIKEGKSNKAIGIKKDKIITVGFEELATVPPHNIEEINDLLEIRKAVQG